jgi:hypothetical protein
MHRWLQNLALVAALAACAALIGCARSGPRDGGAPGAKADKARKEAEALALSAVDGAANAQAKALPEVAVKRDLTWLGGRVSVDRKTWHVTVGSGKGTAKDAPDSKVAAEPPRKPRLPARPGSPVVLSETVASTLPYPTEEEAEDDALEQACAAVERKLGELDPPIRHKPSVGEAKVEFVRADSRALRHPDANEKAAFQHAGVTAELVYVEYDVEVTADQVRELRSRQRLMPALRAFGGLLAVALAAFLFLRVDQWTGGALRVWLALAAVALAAGGVAAAVLV